MAVRNVEVTDSQKIPEKLEAFAAGRAMLAPTILLGIRFLDALREGQ